MYIYMIRNKKNDKVYIGQTVNPSTRRLSAHISQLRKNRHKNHHLQNSWNKYGEKSFQISILEKVTDTSKIDEIERQYIKKYNSNDRDHGYNIFDGGKSGYVIPQETLDKMEMYGDIWSIENREYDYFPLRSPDGKIYAIHNLRRFCKNHNLDSSHIRRVIQGVSKQHRGWRLAYTGK